MLHTESKEVQFYFSHLYKERQSDETKIENK